MSDDPMQQKFIAQVKNLFNHNHIQVERTLMPIRHFLFTASTRF